MNSYKSKLFLTNNIIRILRQKAATSTQKNDNNYYFIASPTRRSRISRRWLSSLSSKTPALLAPPPSSLRIMYGSQTGTAQLFAMQLADEIMSDIESVKVSPCDESPPQELLKRKNKDDGNDDGSNNNDEVLVFLLATTGTGEPTDNSRDFYKWLIKSNNDEIAKKKLLQGRMYTVFALGNKNTYPETFCKVGKRIDSRLEQIGAKRIHPLGIGDDSECIDDDFDLWSQSLIDKLLSATLDDDNEDEETTTTIATKTAEDTIPSSSSVQEDKEQKIDLTVEHQKEKEEENKTSHHYPPNFPEMILNENYPEGREKKTNLFEDGFYKPGTQICQLLYNKLISPCRESLHEVSISLKDHPDMKYEVGDHVWIYPENHPNLAAAYARAIGVDPFAIIEGVKEQEGKNARPYPYPLGLTVEETLQYCVDLGAIPSPTFARFVLDRKVDYRSEVSEPRRTVLDLMLEPGSRKISLGELLYQLPTMQPRYYSIASSPACHPNELLLVYRPVKYWTTRGILREGVCTYFLNSCQAAYDDDEFGKHNKKYLPEIAVGIRNHQAFKLPKDTQTPILMIAGGCGIAPIRSFLDERLNEVNKKAIGSNGQKLFGDAYLFFGCRHDDDEVYSSIIKHSLESGVLNEAHISHSSAATNAKFVAQDIEAHSDKVYDVLKRGGHIYLCGGATAFAPTCEAAILAAIEKHGSLSKDDALEFYMNLVREGRFAEDISA